MHWGEDPVLEKHYVPRRSQRTRSVLTFFAEDAATCTVLYANADLSKASQSREVIAFADQWKNRSRRVPAGRRRRVHLAAARRFFTRAVAAGMGPAEVKTDGVASACGFSTSCSDGAVHRRVGEQPDRGRSRTAQSPAPADAD
jgi:hypothetical protein